MFFITEGNRLSGYDEQRVFQSMETLSDAFMFTTKLLSADVKCGQDVEIVIDNKTLVTGKYERRKGIRSKDITIMGRDKTGDLVDSFVADQTGEFKGLTIKEIIIEICNPFNIKVSGLEGPLVKRYNFNFDMTAGDIIRGLCTRSGLLASSDEEGNLVITNAREAINNGLSITEGVDMHDCEIDIDLTKRYSDYRVYAQSKFSLFEAAEKIFATAPGLQTRHRPFTKINDDEFELADADTESLWQQQYQDGSSVLYVVILPRTIKVSVNEIVNIESPYMGVAGELLVRDLEYFSTPTSQQTTLWMVSPLTYGGTHTPNAFIQQN